MKNLKINYAELGFLMDLSAADAKNIFSQETGEAKVKTDLHLSIEVLEGYFKKIKSVDSRFDGKNAIEFNLEQKKTGYKNHLSSKSMIKKMQFTAGKTIFYKILNDAELKHAADSFKRSHTYLFGIDSMEEQLLKNNKTK